MGKVRQPRKVPHSLRSKDDGPVREVVRWSDLCKFWPKQQLASETAKTHKFTLYGGSRGPGKSRWLRWWLLFRLLWLTYTYNLRGVVVGLFCEDYPQLKDRQIGKISKEFPAWLGTLMESQEYGLGFHVHAAYGGGVLALRNLDDPSKYQSAEFAAMGVDELTKNKVETFDVLRGSLRWAGVPDPECKFVAATNPGSIGHLWVRQYFIDKIYPAELQGLANEFAFVRALPTDNPSLDAGYWEMLNTLPPKLARAWRWGDWDVFEGQAFDTFRRGHHTCKPFTLPAHWPRWRAVDWGFRAPFCCLWFARDPDVGRVFVYREEYKTGLTDRQQARLIKSLTPAWEKIGLTFADPAMWTKKSHEERTFSTADEYSAAGVTLTEADNDRLTGKRKVDTLLMDLDDDRPGLVIFETCTHLIRTLPALPYDKENPEDVDSDAEDHPYDTLKYGLSRVKPAVRKKAEATVINDPILRLVRQGQGGLGSRDL